MYMRSRVSQPGRNVLRLLALRKQEENVVASSDLCRAFLEQGRSLHDWWSPTRPSCQKDRSAERFCADDQHVGCAFMRLPSTISQLHDNAYL